jgi:hypothetical protein
MAPSRWMTSPFCGGGPGSVGYASDRFLDLSATPSTAPIGVSGVADRSRLVSVASVTGAGVPNAVEAGRVGAMGPLEGRVEGVGRSGVGRGRGHEVRGRGIC